MRVAPVPPTVAEGYALATVARVLKVSRQALYRTPKPRTVPQRRPPADPIEQAIVELAQANPMRNRISICPRRVCQVCHPGCKGIAKMRCQGMDAGLEPFYNSRGGLPAHRGYHAARRGRHGRESPRGRTRERKGSN